MCGSDRSTVQNIRFSNLTQLALTLTLTLTGTGAVTGTVTVTVILTLTLTIICLTYFATLYSKVTDRKEPIFSQFTLPNSRPRDDPYVMSENFGQIYVGLQRETDFVTGAKVLSFEPLDPRYMNFKIDFYDQTELVERADLGLCDYTEEANFAARSERSTGVFAKDFSRMHCIEDSKF